MVTAVLPWDLQSPARDKAWRHARTEESDQPKGHRLALGRLLLAVSVGPLWVVSAGKL
jgi:hypothetical protein